MKLLAAGLALVAATAANAQAGHPAHTIVPADSVVWAAGPPSLAPGAQAAVLYGDPTKDGLFVMRLKLPAGFRIAPHTHPRPEILTVVSGAFHIGMGSVADDTEGAAARARRLLRLRPGPCPLCPCPRGNRRAAQQHRSVGDQLCQRRDDPRRGGGPGTGQVAPVAGQAGGVRPIASSCLQPRLERLELGAADRRGRLQPHRPSG